MEHAPGLQVRCRICGLTVDAGVNGPFVRFAGLGRSYMLGKCSSCRRVRLLVIEKRTDPNKDTQPVIGYAPGWRVRCVSCSQQVDAARVGLIVRPDQEPLEVAGPCRRCGATRRLLIERADAARVPDK